MTSENESDNCGYESRSHTDDNETAHCHHAQNTFDCRLCHLLNGMRKHIKCLIAKAVCMCLLFGSHFIDHTDIWFMPRLRSRLNNFNVCGYYDVYLDRSRIRQSTLVQPNLSYSFVCKLLVCRLHIQRMLSVHCIYATAFKPKLKPIEAYM